MVKLKRKTIKSKHQKVKDIVDLTTSILFLTFLSISSPFGTSKPALLYPFGVLTLRDTNYYLTQHDMIVEKLCFKKYLFNSKT